MAKLDMVHIPYQGSATAYVDLMSGRVDMLFGQVAAAIQQIKAGVDPEVSSPEQLAERLKAGQTRITKVIREAGIKLE
jgi:tripartite-type tricarboxylate transporter receptor subunit TctC